MPIGTCIEARAVQGSSSITRSPTGLVNDLNGHCVPSRCRTRRPILLGCARGVTLVSRRDVNGIDVIAVGFLEPYVNHERSTRPKICSMFAAWIRLAGSCLYSDWISAPCDSVEASIQNHSPNNCVYNHVTLVHCLNGYPQAATLIIEYKVHVTCSLCRSEISVGCESSYEKPTRW
jgi:hypothetical protein